MLGVERGKGDGDAGEIELHGGGIAADQDAGQAGHEVGEEARRRIPRRFVDLLDVPFHFVGNDHSLGERRGARGLYQLVVGVVGGAHGGVEVRGHKVQKKERRGRAGARDYRPRIV